MSSVYLTQMLMSQLAKEVSKKRTKKLKWLYWSVFIVLLVLASECFGHPIRA